jgi:hypothetical protein
LFREGLHPLLGYCDNTAEALAGMLRPGSAGSNTTADHLTVLDAAIAAVPARHRRRLMVTCDGAGASHGLIEHLDELARRLTSTARSSTCCYPRAVTWPQPGGSSSWGCARARSRPRSPPTVPRPTRGSWTGTRQSRELRF